jgi:hypothetical protein
MTLAPVGPQPSPTRAAASATVEGTRRRARGPSVDDGDELHPA